MGYSRGDPESPLFGRLSSHRKALIGFVRRNIDFSVERKNCLLYAVLSEKNKDKHFVHAIYVIDFSKDDPFSGRTTIHSDDPSPSSSTVKTSDNLEKFTDELTPLNSLPPGDDIDEIDVFLAMENSMDYEKEMSFHHEFAGEIITLPSRNDHEHEDYLNRMTLLSKISISRSQENVHANPSLIIESLPASPIPVEDSEPVQEEIDIFLVTDDLIPPGIENDDSEDEDNEFPNLDHQDDPSIPRPPPEPPDVEKCLEPEADDFILFISLSFLSLGSEDLIFDPGISTFHFSLKTVPFALPEDE
ncbi:hypothetical protein Tco_0642564 [Tanacetum coccineum]